MKALWIVLLAAFASIAPAQAGEPPFFKQQGIKVLSSQKGPGGLMVWKVEKGGTKTVFYTTADGKVLINGVIWDAATGANLSDAFLADIAAPVPAAAVPGQVPEAIKSIDRLAGVREGKGGPERTLYIIFDPRCPHCHAVYAKARQFISQGGTIKWIPATVLGHQSSVPYVAYVLQDANPLRALSVVMTLGDKAPVGTKPTPQTVQAVAENEAYFWAAFERNPSAGQTGVPVGFFLDKNGVPQMVGEMDNDVLLKSIFSDLLKK